VKKKLNNMRQLQNKYVVRFIIALVLVVFFGAMAALLVYKQVESKTVAQVKAEYQTHKDELKLAIDNKYDAEYFSSLGNDVSKQDELVNFCKENGYFYTYILYYESSGGHAIYAGDDNALKVSISTDRDGATLEEQGIPYVSDGQAQFKGKSYLFYKIELDYTYRILAVVDFDAEQSNLDSLVGNSVGILVAAEVIILAIFLAYAYSVSGREMPVLFKYRLRLDKSGKVISSNAAFKKDYSLVYEIPSPEKLDRHNFTMVTVNSTSGDSSALALRAIGSGEKLRVYGGTLSNASSFIAADEHVLNEDGLSTSQLSNLFDKCMHDGKRALIGVLLVTNLEKIKTLFGKQMSLDLQKIIMKKVKEKFGYAFELDFAYIGVAYPDGKNLDNLIVDLDDVFRYINTPLRMEDNLFTLDIKAGFAMCDSTMQPQTFEHAFRAAEAAKQRVLDTNVADYVIYKESQKKLYAKYFIKFDIKQMLSEGAFEMEYQPQYNIKQNRVEGFEALFRVKKSWNVNVDTFSFITYAERTGAMVQLGDFIFDTGMAFAKSIEGKDVSVSLNVSPVQLMQAGFIENFLGIYRKYNLKPGSICVEITESFLMKNFTETLRKLDVLTRQGIKVHLDDFGTEYSSLLYIKKLPISTIKIDKEFVKDVLVSQESQSIIKFITNLAKLLKGTTICEGVETVKEYDMLNFLGCDTIQGWVISKSLKDEAAVKFIDEFDYAKVVAAQQAKETHR